jgi:hypothetical protein
MLCIVHIDSCYFCMSTWKNVPWGIKFVKPYFYRSHRQPIYIDNSFDLQHITRGNLSFHTLWYKMIHIRHERECNLYMIQHLFLMKYTIPIFQNVCTINREREYVTTCIYKNVHVIVSSICHYLHECACTSFFHRSLFTWKRVYFLLP